MKYSVANASVILVPIILCACQSSQSQPPSPRAYSSPGQNAIQHVLDVMLSAQFAEISHDPWSDNEDYGVEDIGVYLPPALRQQVDFQQLTLRHQAKRGIDGKYILQHDDGNDLYIYALNESDVDCTRKHGASQENNIIVEDLRFNEEGNRATVHLLISKYYKNSSAKVELELTEQGWRITTR